MANKKRKKSNEISNQKKKVNNKNKSNNKSKGNNQANTKNEINEKLKQVLIEKLIEKLK